MLGGFEPKADGDADVPGEPRLYKDTFKETFSVSKPWTGRKLGRLPLSGTDIEILKKSGLAKFNEDDYLIELSTKSTKPENYKNYKKETEEEILQKIRNLSGRIAVKMKQEDEASRDDGYTQGGGAFGKLEGGTF